MVQAPYDMTLLNSGTSIIDTILVFNYWSDGILFSGLLIVFAFIVFSASRYADVELENAMMYATFFGAVVGALGWLFRFQNTPAIPTLLPIMFTFFLGGSIIYKLMKGSIKQID